MKAPQFPFTPEAFVKAWQEADSVADVAEKFGLTADAARNKAAFLRKKGIPLKEMPPGRRTAYDIEKLKKIAKKGGKP